MPHYRWHRGASRRGGIPDLQLVPCCLERSYLAGPTPVRERVPRDVNGKGVIRFVDRANASICSASGTTNPYFRRHPCMFPFAPLSLGSIRSLRASPSILNPKTAALMASPGQTAIQGAVSRYVRALPLSIPPQEG